MVEQSLWNKLVHGNVKHGVHDNDIDIVNDRSLGPTYVDAVAKDVIHAWKS